MRLIPALPALLFLAALDAQHLARADNWGHPMTFALIVGSILADGDIVPDTPQELERFLAQNRIPINNKLFLNSRGGDLWAGLKMGTIIRAHRLHTSRCATLKTLADLQGCSIGCFRWPSAYG